MSGRPGPKPAPRYLTTPVAAHPNSELVIADESLGMDVRARERVVAGWPAHIVADQSQMSNGSWEWVAPRRCGAVGHVVTPRTGFSLAAFKSTHCPRCLPGLAQRRAA